MKSAILAAAFTLLASMAMAAEKYVLDPSHSQIVFSYNHLGYSTGYGMFSGFEGEITFDRQNPAHSRVAVSIHVLSILTGWEERFNQFMSDEFFGAAEGDMITFTSTGIEVTGETTARITGNLTMNDVTQSVVLDATLNQIGPHPMEGKEWAGFDATTTLKRTDFNLGAFAPFISDEVYVTISVEAMKVQSDNS